MRLIAICLITVTFVFNANGQVSIGPDVEARFSVAAQPRFTYAKDSEPGLERTGFGLRRARLRTTVTYKNSSGVRLHLDIAGGTASAVDLFAFYQASPRVRFRAGYFAGSQPRALIPTSFTVTDGPDRAAITDRWSRSTIGSNGRDLGVDVEYANGGTRLSLFVHNGDGSLSRSNFRTGIGGLAATGGTDQQGLAVSASVTHKFENVEGLEFGGFAGHNGSKNPNTSAGASSSGRNYDSFSAHVYWGATPGSQPVRLKAEIIGTSFNSNTVDPGQDAIGYALTAAGKLVAGVEIVGSFEQYTANVDASADTYLMAALNFSPSARRGLPFHQERVTIAYLHGTPGANTSDTQHQLVVQLQYALW